MKKNVYDSLMALTSAEKLHKVAYYNDDTGYGSTSCGIRVFPWDSTISGRVTCETCKIHMDGRWIKRMAEMEDL